MSEQEWKGITGIRSSISWSLFHPSGFVILVSSWNGRPIFCFPVFLISKPSSLPAPTPLPHTSVQFSRSGVSDSLWSHELQHTRLTCPSPTPGAAQTHVHRVSDVIQPFHPPTSPSPALNLSQHPSIFQRDSSSYQVAKVLELQLQHQSPQWILRTDFL